MTYMKILLLLMFCTVLPMQAQQMKKLTDLKDFEARLYLANLHTSFLCNLIYPTFSRILLYSC